MRILYDSENLLDQEMMDTFIKAASLCVEREGLNPDNAEISLTFMTPEEIRQLNNTYRNIDNHTDVLSFPLIEDFTDLSLEDEFMLGDVVICLQQAKAQAAEYGHSEQREIVYLFVHSVYHLLGYDHMEERDKQQMRQKEEAVMSLLEMERSLV